MEVGIEKRAGNHNSSLPHAKADIRCNAKTKFEKKARREKNVGVQIESFGNVNFTSRRAKAGEIKKF